MTNAGYHACFHASPERYDEEIRHRRRQARDQYLLAPAYSTVRVRAVRPGFRPDLRRDCTARLPRHGYARGSIHRHRSRAGGGARVPDRRRSGAERLSGGFAHRPRGRAHHRVGLGRLRCPVPRSARRHGHEGLRRSGGRAARTHPRRGAGPAHRRLVRLPHQPVAEDGRQRHRHHRVSHLPACRHVRVGPARGGYARAGAGRRGESGDGVALAPHAHPSQSPDPLPPADEGHHGPRHRRGGVGRGAQRDVARLLPAGRHPVRGPARHRGDRRRFCRRRRVARRADEHGVESPRRLRVRRRAGRNARSPARAASATARSCSRTTGTLPARAAPPT